MAMAIGISTRRIDATPVAVIDFETTGLTPGLDRVVEVSVVRIEPGEAPRLVFDTLVNPERPMAATQIHRITEAEVAGAPRFDEIVGDFLAAMQGCMIAAYNVYFDIRFLEYELSKAGVRHAPPHFCLMYLRPLLGLGRQCDLASACMRHGVDFQPTHAAADDAIAAAHLFGHYRRVIDRRGIETYDDLAALRSYKFTSSFARDPFPAPAHYGLSTTGQVRSRATTHRISPLGSH